MNKFLLSFLAICIILFTGCSEKDDPSGNNTIHETTQSINGKVEKGPFVRGSIVELRTLNADMTATGKSFTATIENNYGDFDFGTITAESQFAKLQAEGYFFNEVNGELSPSTIHLNAIVDLTDSRTVNVNILTHLKSERIVKLAKQGSSYKEANEQAQKELLTAFGLQNHSLKDASQFSITSGDDAAGALIAISSLILYNRNVAEIVEFLSQLTEEFSNLGTFRPATKEVLRKTRNELNDKFSDIEFNVRNRYNELGLDVTVKDLAFFFDWDNNGIAGDELESGLVNFSQTKISAPASGGDFSIEISSDKPYYLEIPESLLDGVTLEPSPGTITDSYFQDLYDGDYSPKAIKYTKSLNNNIISIHVDAADFYTSQMINFPIFNARGKQVGIIEIEQIGKSGVNPDIPNLGNDGRNFWGGLLRNINSANVYLGNRELRFFNDPNIRITSDDRFVSDAWNSFYSTINRLLVLKTADAYQLGVYQDFCNVHLAILYTSLITYWDGVIFFDEYNSDPMESMNRPRTSKSDIIEKLLSWTEKPLETFKEDKVVLTDANSTFFLNKDVVRIIRAKLFMEKGDYRSALPLLESVINSGRYTLTNEPLIRFDDKEECILATYISDNAGYSNTFTQNGIKFIESVTPIFDLKEIYMDAAECAYHISDASKTDKYINAYKQAKGISTSETGLKAIEDLRIKTQLPFTTPCVRRCGLGNNVLGLDNSTWYQTTWPIPASQMALNPNMTQNPGY